MGQLPERQRDPADVFQASVDGLSGTVARAGMVEEGQDVIAALVQGPTELGEFLQALESLSSCCVSGGLRGLARGRG